MGDGMDCLPGMRAVEAKHARKIEADGGCRGTGRVACPVEIGAARRGCAPRRRVDAAAPVRRDWPARRAGDLAAVAVAPIAPKGFAWRRPRHTLKGRQDAAAVEASHRHLADL